MGYATASVRHYALLALAVGFIAATPPAARAIELRELAGWWIAIDDTFPRLWQQGAIAPAEEILQINFDGRVQDRVLNFWAGSAQVCLEHKVCSDLPAINYARMRVSGDKVTFHAVTALSDKVDTEDGDAAIRREAITASADWTAAIAGDRLTLRRPGKLRVLARIEPARLRKLYAGMRVAGWPPAEHWRCFLANATAADNAFAPLRSARRAGASVPDFLDRYLGLATYINAIHSTIAIPAIDESDEERRKRLAVNTDEQMVQYFDTILRPPSFDDRQRLQAVLAYIDTHTRTTIAHNAAAAASAREQERFNAAAAEAARVLRLAREADAAASAAHAIAMAAAANSEKAHNEAAAQAEAARNSAAAAREAEAAAHARQTAATAAAAAHEAARLAAEAQRRKSEAAAAAHARQQQKLEAAIREASPGAGPSSASAAPEANLDQRVIAAILAIRDALRALGAARDQAKATADAVAAARQAEAEAEAREQAKLAGVTEAAANAAGIALDAAKAAHAAHAKAKSESETAAHEAARRAGVAQTAASALSAAQDAENAANAVRDRAKAESDAAADAAAKAATMARDAANAASAAREAMQAAAATQPKGEGFIPITTADIAALAHVVGESNDAKKLFCRGEYASGSLPAATR